MKKLTTNILTWENIQNQSSYSASAVSLSGSYGSNSPSQNPDNAAFRESALGQAFANSASSSSPGFTPGLPAHESGGDGSTTYATISAGRLNIGGKDTSVEELGIHSNPESAHRQIEALPDLQQLMQNQQTVAQSTATIASAVRTFSGNMAQKAALEQEATRQETLDDWAQHQPEQLAKYNSKETEAEKTNFLLENSPSFQTAYETKASWGIGGSNSRALNAATTLITGALGGQTDLQAAANALAPYAAAGIGQQFGHGDNQNEAAQAVSHFVLGATLAYINGSDPLSGGSAAVAAETAAQYLSRQYNDGQTARDPITGEFNPNLLPESVKEEIRTTTGAIAALVGATGDGSAAFNAQVAAVIGQNAVENNQHLKIGQRPLKQAELRACKGDLTCEIAVEKRWENIAIQNQRDLYTACDKGTKTASCTNLRNQIDTNTYAGWKDYTYPTGMQLSGEAGAMLGLGPQVNAKVAVSIGNRGAAIQAEGGVGLGVGASAYIGKADSVKIKPNDPHETLISTEYVIGEKTIGTQASGKNATLGTKLEVEGKLGAFIDSAIKY